LAQYLDVYAKQVEKSPAEFSKLTIKRYLDLENVKLVVLPEKYSDLAKIGADYQCENFINMMSTDQEGHGDFVGQMSNNSHKEVVMCLFCGQLLCWNSICR